MAVDREDINGILNLSKPYGITSMEAVRRIKRASGLKRVGHGGTLDPVATGVLPICLGQATRVMEYLVEGRKEYQAVIELGVDTDTNDSLGKVTNKQDPSHITESGVVEALASIQGTTEQVPPMYSALKREGKRLYELARAGIEIERKPRKVEIYAIRLLEWSPPMLTLEVECGRGLYMRRLAYDLGQLLGCGAHLSQLVRLRSGPFAISEAVSLEEAVDKFADGSYAEILRAPDVVVYHLDAVILGARLEEMVRHGRPIPPIPRMPVPRAGELCRVYGVQGNFIAILSFNAAAGHWQPDKVFSLHYQ